MDFTPKRRLMSAIKGEQTDRVPFSPFLAYYFDFLPEDVRQKGELEYLESIGADPLLRGAIQAYSVQSKTFEYAEKISGNTKQVVISNNNRNLIKEYTYTKTSNSWFLSRHPVGNLDEIHLLLEYYKDLQVLPAIADANSKIDALGERGLQLAIIGIDCKSSFQSLLEHWIGTENLSYFCEDYPDEIDELVRNMMEKSKKTVEYTAESKAFGCISWEDSSTQNLSPKMYEKFIKPEITMWCNLMRQAEKPYIQHACGHLKDLLVLMAEQGISGIESISPLPTGNIYIADAVSILPKNIAIIGGIEPTHFLNDSVETLLDTVEELIYVNKDRGFVLANSDSCPPGVEYEKFVKIADYVRGIANVVV